MPEPLKLNLGCGNNLKPGYVNVDKFGVPDVRHDLEVWPWAENSVDRIDMHHVLEHLGQIPAVYCRIVQELYRICKPGATIEIVVPHHKHDYFADDPTHVRIVTPAGLRLFDQAFNDFCAKNSYANSPLGQNYGVDFETVHSEYRLSSDYKLPQAEAPFHCNSIEETRITLRAVKPPRFARPESL